MAEKKEASVRAIYFYLLIMNVNNYLEYRVYTYIESVYVFVPVWLL